MSEIGCVSSFLLDRWEKTELDSRRQLIDNVADLLGSIFKIIARNDSGSLWSAVKDSIRMKTIMNEKIEEESSIDIIAEAYNNCDEPAVKEQLLSLVANRMTYEDVEKAIPGITASRYYRAKKHAKMMGAGQLRKRKKLTRERVNPGKLDHLINYMVSPDVVTDVPYGMRSLKLTSGVKIDIPNVVRKTIPEEFFRQYSAFCDQTNFERLGRTTILAVLKKCKASTQKSLAGLDYFSSDSSEAFSTLEELIEELPGGQISLKKQLRAFKAYLKTDYRVC